MPAEAHYQLPRASWGSGLRQPWSARGQLTVGQAAMTPVALEDSRYKPPARGPLEAFPGLRLGVIIRQLAKLKMNITKMRE